MQSIERWAETCIWHLHWKFSSVCNASKCEGKAPVSVVLHELAMEEWSGEGWQHLRFRHQYRAVYSITAVSQGEGFDPPLHWFLGHNSAY